MHGDGQTLLWESLNNHALFGDVVPDSNGLILGACNDKLLPDTDIETCDCISVEATVNEVYLNVGVRLIVQGKLSPQDLVVLSDVVDVVTRV